MYSADRSDFAESVCPRAGARARSTRRAGAASVAPPSPARIGFLFNHDQIHQIAHSLPIALALADSAASCEIVVASTNDLVRREIKRLAGARLGRITMVDLDTRSRTSRALERMFGGMFPARKLLIYRDNLEFFRSLDVLVVSERTSLLLKTRYGLDRPLMILADHGAGDRAIGFNRQTALFDHILAAGPKIRDRLIRDAGVAPDRLSVTGYPKFDAVPDFPARLPVQANGRPTVLYNPHLSPHLSSWFTMGNAILDYFLWSDRYNLIFAPHIMLFQRTVAITIDKLRIARPGPIHERFIGAPNIHIDTGSVASTDMTYVRCADIYLGDVSSQIYEFLEKPRPAVFLNAHGHAWQGDDNFAHWQAGPVVDCISTLDEALDEARETHEAVYRPMQQRLFDYTFDRTARPAAQRAADAILAFIAAPMRAADSGDIPR